MNKMEFNITKLKGSANFHTWKFAMKNFLEMNDLVGCITPSDDDVQKPREAKADKISQAKTRIILSMDRCMFMWKIAIQPSRSGKNSKTYSKIEAGCARLAYCVK